MIRKKVCKALVVQVLTVLLLLNASLFPAYADSPMEPAGMANGGSNGELTVALYPWVPRLDQFKEVITAAWSKLEPGVALKYVTWDCYSEDPPKDLDVFVFDAIYLSYFQAKGFLSAFKPGEVDNPDDFLEYALEGAKVKGTQYGIPQLGCAGILFYRQGDEQLEKAETLSAVTQAIGECTYSTEIPPANTGLMVNISGGTTSACYYLEAVEDIYNKYTDAPPLPPDNTKIGSWEIQNVQKLLRMASVKQAQYSQIAYQRGTWFGQGLGRAMIGYTEAMSAMGEKALETVAFKPMPLSDNADGVSLFYSDVISINSTVTDPGERLLALKLANLIASTDVVVACFGPTAKADYPQYLMPVRKSVFDKLGTTFPIYETMHKMVLNSHPYLFRIGPDSKPWLKALKGDIKDRIYKGACQ
ncbi:MAG: thiamine pyridinylase [bacterium]|nr:thiamine pyridinylase [bacterium]